MAVPPAPPDPEGVALQAAATSTTPPTSTPSVPSFVN
jgi:hypothetical protein